jgi:flavin-binding protein dodecin
MYLDYYGVQGGSMLRMITVTETSEAGYSDAVKKAVEGLAAKGEKVHFFVMQEHRGTFAKGNIEYQVVVQAAVE